MRSVTTERFRKAYERLPANVKLKAREVYARWNKNLYHPSLNYKQIHKTKSIYAVRVGNSYRALGVKNKNTMIWFWIGSHEEYNNLISQL